MNHFTPQPKTTQAAEGLPRQFDAAAAITPLEGSLAVTLGSLELL